MGSSRRYVRMFAAFWAVLQFALPMATLYADAFSARSSDRHVAHVEDSTSDNCRPVHAEECALCRFLSNSSAPLGRADTGPIIADAPTRPADSRELGCVAPTRGLPSSRAPPTI